LIFSSVIGYDGKITRDELSHNEGYLMTDYIGKSGIEKYYEKQLKGINGATAARAPLMALTDNRFYAEHRTIGEA